MTEVVDEPHGEYVVDLDRLTTDVTDTLSAAQESAVAAGTELGVSHLVRALVDRDPMVREAMRDETLVRLDRVEQNAQRGPANLSPAVGQLLQEAQRFADDQDEPWVSVEHLLYALAADRRLRRSLFLTRDSIAQLIADRREYARRELNPPPPPGPFDRLDRTSLLELERILHRRVISQDRAVTVVANSIRRHVAGLADTNRPFGTFLFLGPTGVGKTELAKALAEYLYGSELAMTRLDMAEYMERHTVSRMIGSPPGYVGYEEGGQLTEVVKENPQSLVLLDEMEKAHGDVLNVLLAMLDDGRMTSGQGDLVDFRQCVIVMTSNVGSHLYQEKLTPKERKDLVMRELWAALKPEFLNRIDEIVVFDSLTKVDFGAIVDLQLRPVSDRLREQGLALEVDTAAREYLVEGGWNPVLGARQLRRFIQREVQDPLASRLLALDHAGKARVTVTRSDAGLQIDLT